MEYSKDRVFCERGPPKQKFTPGLVMVRDQGVQWPSIDTQYLHIVGV